MSFRLRIDNADEIAHGGPYTRCSLFVGDTEGSYALAGALALRHDEFEALSKALADDAAEESYRNGYDSGYADGQESLA